MASLKGLLKTAFPFIATGLESINPVVGALAKNFLGKALGVDKPNPGDDELETAFSRVTPDQLPALITAITEQNNQFQAQMAQMGYKSAADLAAIDAGDRDSARKREMSVRDKTPEFLAFVFVIGYFVLLGYILHWGIRPDSHDVIISLISILTASVAAIIGYYFGASRSGDRASQALAQGVVTVVK